MQAASKTQQNLKLFTQSQKLYSSFIRKRFFFSNLFFFFLVDFFCNKGKNEISSLLAHFQEVYILKILETWRGQLLR